MCLSLSPCSSPSPPQSHQVRVGFNITTIRVHDGIPRFPFIFIGSVPWIRPAHDTAGFVHSMCRTHIQIHAQINYKRQKCVYSLKIHPWRRACLRKQNPAECARACMSQTEIFMLCARNECACACVCLRVCIQHFKDRITRASARTGCPGRKTMCRDYWRAAVAVAVGVTVWGMVRCGSGELCEILLTDILVHIRMR